MMSIGAIKQQVAVARSIREDWQFSAVESAVAELAANYDDPDVAYAVVTIARDTANRAPITISLKGPDVIAALHAKTAGPRTPGPETRNKRRLCAICQRRQDQCQEAAGNRGELRDHDYISMEDYEKELPEGHRLLRATDLPTLPSPE